MKFLSSIIMGFFKILDAPNVDVYQLNKFKTNQTKYLFLITIIITIIIMIVFLYVNSVEVLMDVTPFLLLIHTLLNVVTIHVSIYVPCVTMRLITFNSNAPF